MAAFPLAELVSGYVLTDWHGSLRRLIEWSHHLHDWSCLCLSCLDKSKRPLYVVRLSRLTNS